MMQFIATFFYVGHMRAAPGTWGSLAAIPFGYVILSLFGFWGLTCAVILCFGLGWWATAQVTKGQDDHDPSEVVIDEVAGQWIALLPLGFFGFDWIAIILAFAAFRFFDILKPGPVGTMDRRGDAFGVMADDIVAGVFAAVCVAAYLWIFV